MRILLFMWIGCLTLLGVEGVVTKGKSFLITLSSPSGIIMNNEQNISVISHPTDRTLGIAIIPIDYYSLIEDRNLTWIAPGKQEGISLSIRDGAYPTETLSVDPAKVTPPLEALERIEKERMEAEKIYSRFTPIRYWDKPFIKPLDTFITSEYGSARTYNGTLKSYHGGIDFRARTPLPILSTNDGIVVLAEDRYYAGGTVIIDHGEGLYSCYFHMSQFDVSIGERVSRGQSIGLTGATGRITGPHLHFGLMVLGHQSDPLDLIEQINTLFPKEPNETLTRR